MAGTQNTISSLVAQFLRLQKNSLEIINGLNQVAVSTNNTVSIEVLDEQGLPKTANIPSYGFLRGEIDRLDNNIKSLAGIGDSSSTVRNPDGTYSQVFKVETLKNPPSLSNLAVPSTFAVKDNWFFESFLTPLLYISINVTGQISDAADRIVVKRVIANTQTDDQKAYFDANIKGRNDLSYDQYLKLLNDNGIGYFVDEDIVQLPLRTIRYIGNFGVISYYDDTVTSVDANGNSFQETRRNYKLDKIAYTDTLTNVKDGKSLDAGDKVATQDGSLYQVTAVNKDQASIQAKRVSGYQPIQIGANSISISSTDFGPRYVQVNVGYNERQGIFFKTIDDNFNIVSADWSTGVVFWSNELKTKNSSGELVTLETYYLNEVSDLGKAFLGAAKENKIPAIQGLRPDAPKVTVDSFKVVQINKQVTDSTSVKVVEDKLNLKTTLKSEIDALDQAIAETRLELNAGLSRHVTHTQSPRSFISDYTQFGNGYDNGINVPNRNYDNIITNSNITSPPGTDVASIRANLNSLIDERTKKAQLYASLVDEVNVLVKDVPQIVEAPKYRVRGFWPFPAPKIDPTTGAQEVIQFNVKYRYLSNGGASQPAEQIEFVDNDGAKKNAAFSNWTEYKTDIRKKVYDETKGIYVWSAEVTSDANVQNVNQLDIAITKGERVEIQISSISEAGWPENPLTSDYSDSVIIQFPDSLSVTGVADTLNTNTQDAAVVKMQRTLDSQGLPSHLSQQFTAGNNTYYHDTTGIASGFFTSAGTVISLFDKITDLQNQITLLTAQLSKAKGVLEVYILDSNNNKIKVSKGSTVKITAGFYSDIFSDPLGFDAGKTASFTYNLQLFNQQASSVELASIIPGGLAQKAPSTISASFPVGYNDNLRYGDCPISLTALTLTDPSIIDNKWFRQAPPFASANAYSQYVYPRFKTVGYDQPLYQSDASLSTYFINPPETSSYSGNALSATNFGITKNGTSATYPQSGSFMIPYNPTVSPPPESGPTNSAIWNGTYSGVTGGTANGGGYITEFCIHKDHPYLITVGQTNGYSTYEYMVKPFVSGGKVYPPFRHTQTFWGDTTLNYYWIQQAHRDPVNFAQTSTDVRTDSMYADKLGFTVNDQFLIGKYSCGAYLYLAPQSGSSIQVSGTTALSTLSLGTGETNAINVPIIFQFRAVDKLGYIGGWRKSGNLSNITYTKKIGIDIQIQNEDSFSFDVQVTGSYKNDTLVAPNFDSGLTTN
jgi:hypothetical protein